MYLQPMNRLHDEFTKVNSFRMKQRKNNRGNGVMFFTQSMKMAGDYYRTGKKTKKLHVDKWIVLKKE